MDSYSQAIVRCAECGVNNCVANTNCGICGKRLNGPIVSASRKCPVCEITPLISGRCLLGCGYQAATYQRKPPRPLGARYYALKTLWWLLLALNFPFSLMSRAAQVADDFTFGPAYRVGSTLHAMRQASGKNKNRAIADRLVRRFG